MSLAMSLWVKVTGTDFLRSASLSIRNRCLDIHPAHHVQSSMSTLSCVFVTCDIPHAAQGTNVSELFEPDTSVQVLRKAPEKEQLQLEYPPSAYYTSYMEPEAMPAHRMLTGKAKRTRSSTARQ